MKVVYVLGDYIHVVVFFQLHESLVCVVRHFGHEVVAAGIVELMHKLRVAPEAVGRSHFHNGIVFPKPSGIAESGYTAFCAYACS